MSEIMWRGMGEIAPSALLCNAKYKWHIGENLFSQHTRFCFLRIYSKPSSLNVIRTNYLKPMNQIRKLQEGTSKSSEWLGILNQTAVIHGVVSGRSKNM